MLLGLGVSTLLWFSLLYKAQLNRRKGKICKVPKNIRGCGGDDEQPEIKAQPLTAEQQMMNEAFANIQMPYMQSKYKEYQDIYQPMTKSLGASISKQLSEPLTLPEDVWNNIWQKSKANTIQGYNETRQTAGERLAGKGMLNQPVSEKYFQNLDLAQAKSIESLAIDMAIQQWTEKKTAQQQAIANASNFVSGAPNFTISPQVPQYYTTQNSGNDYSGLLGAVGTGAGAIVGSSYGQPWIGAMIGQQAGSGLSTLFQ